MTIESDMYVLKNVGDEPWWTYVGLDEFTIEPGKTKTVTWQYVDGLFGDPRIMNLEYDKRRDDAYNYLAARHGMSTLGGVDTSKRPPIEVYVLDTGERFITLLEDPDGTQTLDLAESTEHSEVELLRRRLAQLEARLDPTPVDEDDLPPVDDIKTVKVSK